MIRRVLLLALAAVSVNAAAFAQACPQGASWCSGTYAYDGMGNIRAIGSDIYIYDTAGRLVSGTAENQRGGISRQDYGYDTFGNRTSASRIVGSVDCLGGCEQSPAIDPVTNHITGNSAVYDAAGNLISITNTVNSTPFTATYDYDAAGSMTRATAGSDVRQFIYTADDERIATRNGQSWTWTVRGLDNKVLREFTSLEPNGSPGLPTTNRQWSKDYVWRDGLLLSTVSASASGNITEHFHLDHLGTPRLVSNDAGVQVGIHAYYPFGAELILSPETPVELMKFTGHERDQLASNPNTLDYMHARYEMGTMGRFLSIDPAGRSEPPATPQSWNRYTYARNSPLNRIDPDGLRDIYVAIWNRRFPYFKWGSVGHAAAFEMNGDLILSQFPQNKSYHGRNVSKSYSDTVSYEKRLPDHVYKVFVPNDQAFDDEVHQQKTAYWWDWEPTSLDETNCSFGLGIALVAGGVPVPMFDINYIPDDLNNWLANNLSTENDSWSGVRSAPNDVLGPMPTSKNSDLRGDENPWLLSNAFGTEIIVIRP